jgi:hypothetical protein
VADDHDADFAVDGFTIGESALAILTICGCTYRATERSNLHLLQAGKDKDRGLAHTRLGLTEDVSTEDSLRNALLLYCQISFSSRCRAMCVGRQLTFRGVLETEVRDGTKQLGLQQEVTTRQLLASTLWQR